MIAERLDRPSPALGRIYSLAAVVAGGAFVVGAFVLALALPYHDWDAFAFGVWSRAIAEHGRLDPFGAGELGSARPLFYLLQGGLWSVTGISFTAGRLLGLAFGIVLIAAVWLFVRAETDSSLDAALAAIAVVAIPAFAQETLEGKSDVPAAAALAVVAWLAVSSRPSRGRLVLVGVAAFLAVLVKPTILVPAAVLAVVLFVRRRRDRASPFPRIPAALAVGLGAGVVYELVMALRFHTGLLAYLRSGTTDGLYAQLAAAARWHAALRADVLGEALRVPLTFGLLYGLARTLGARHRVAARIAFPGSLVWSVAGPYAAGVPHGPFGTSESTFTLVGFAAMLAATLATDEDDAPRRGPVVLAFLLGASAWLVWLESTAYADRLASASWPGLAALIGLVLAAAVQGLRRLGFVAALAPLPIVAVAVWMALAGFDGLHGPDWVSFRALGWSGLWNKERTMNLVLPSVQSALAAAAPPLARGGTLVADDPSFQYFLPPGRVETRLALHCGELTGSRVFILSTADESEWLARHEHGLAVPAQWSRCTSPKLQQLTDGTNGYAVFAIDG